MSIQNYDYNKIIVSGTVEYISDLSYTSDKTPILNFRLHNRVKNHDDIFDVTVWGNLALIAESSIYRDQRILVEGNIQRCGQFKKNRTNSKFEAPLEIAAKKIFGLNDTLYFRDYVFV